MVEDLLDSRLRIVYTVQSSSLEDNERGAVLSERIERAGIEHGSLPEREFDALSATEAPQGILAVAEIPRWGFDELERTAGVVLVLDAVQDPGNFGTLVRSAEALGVVGVVALTGTVDPWNPKAVRASAGSSFRVPVIQAEAETGLSELRRRGFRLLGADAGGEPIGKAEAERVALVVGNEGSGLSGRVREMLDGLVAVPIRGRAESLNVAAAAAILLYELTR